MKIGKVSENVLKRSVLRQLNTTVTEMACGAGVGEDCAIFAFPQKEMTVTCMQEATVAVSGNTSIDISTRSVAGKEPLQTMEALIQKCANNLVTAGAVPVSVMITLLLPEYIEEPDIKALMASAKEKCRELSMVISGGQTKVTDTVTFPVAVVTGIGRVAPQNMRSGKSAAPGQDVVISKWIGLQGTSLVAKKNRERLLSRYPAYLVEEAEGFDRYLSVIPEAATAIKSGVCAMHDASEGGIFAALWELAEGAGVGLTIDMKKLPLRQETVEVCECCNMNPYELLSGGCLVMTTQDGPGLVSALHGEGIPAVIVGKVTDSKDRILINEDEVRYMDKPKQDEIYRNNEI